MKSAKQSYTWVDLSEIAHKHSQSGEIMLLGVRVPLLEQGDTDNRYRSTILFKTAGNKKIHYAWISLKDGTVTAHTDGEQKIFKEIAQETNLHERIQSARIAVAAEVKAFIENIVLKALQTKHINSFTQLNKLLRSLHKATKNWAILAEPKTVIPGEHLYTLKGIGKMYDEYAHRYGIDGKDFQPSEVDHMLAVGSMIDHCRPSYH